MLWNPTRATATNLLIDDWESGDQTGWVGATGETSVTTTAIQGTYSLEHTASTFSTIHSGPGVSNPLPNYPSKGDTVSWLVDTDALTEDIWLVAFGSGDGTTPSTYNLQARITSASDFVLREEVNDTETDISADTSGPIPTDTIIEVTLQWHDGTDGPNNDATATAYNWDTSSQSRGTELASETGAVDSSHDTNNNGVVELWFEGTDGTQVERIDRHVILGGGTGGGGGSATIVDSFEDQDMAEYVSPNDFAFVSGTTGVVDGTYAVEYTGFDLTSSTSGDGLNAYPQKGDEFRFYITMTGGQSKPAVGFGSADSDNTYTVELQGETGEFRLRKRESGSGTNLATTSYSFALDTVYEVRVTWDDGTLGGSDDDITVELWDYAAGTLEATLGPINDSTFASNVGIALLTRNIDSGEAQIYDYYHITNR